MPRNVYFSHGSNAEQILFEDIQIEALKIYGHETYYLPRKILTRDMILNEDRESLFDDAYMIEMYIEDIEGFGGEGNLMSKFGIEIRDEVTFVVARRSWNKLVGIWNNTVDNFRPNEGDLIYLPLSNSLFEISFVEHEQPFYQIQNLPVYKLQARLFEYNDEDFRTGIYDIDNIETVHADILSMLVRDITGEIELGKRYYQLTPTVEYLDLVQRKEDLPGLISDKESAIEVIEAQITTLTANIATTTTSLNTANTALSNANAQLVALQSQLQTLFSQLQTLQPGSPQYNSVSAQISSVQGQIASIEIQISQLESNVTTYTTNLTDYNNDLLTAQTNLSGENDALDDLNNELDNEIDNEIAAVLADLPYVSGVIVEQDQVGGTSVNRTIYITDIESSTTDVKDFYISTDAVEYTYITDSIENPTMTARIYEIYDFEDSVDRTFENDDAAQNYDFEKEAESIIDFSEKNPFGEPS